MKKLGFIGGGNMAKAIIKGLLKQNFASDNLFVVDPNERCQKHFLDLNIFSSGTVDPVVSNVDILILAVKPQILPDVLLSINPFLKPNHVIVSIVAGITIAQVRKYLGDVSNSIIRVMPNTPALVGFGMSVLVSDANLNQLTKDTVTRIFESFGKALWITNEENIDAVTAVSGSGPAYFFLLIESLIKTGKRLGLNEQTCRLLVTQTALGAAHMVETSDVEPDILRQQVTSPGGTTEAALQVFEEEDFSGLIDRALIAAKNRANALSHTTS